VIGDLGDFGRGDPSKHTGRLFGSRSLLRRRYRSLFSFPSRVMRGCSEKRGLSAFSTNLSQNHGIFNILDLKEKGEVGGRVVVQELDIAVERVF